MIFHPLFVGLFWYTNPVNDTPHNLTSVVNKGIGMSTQNPGTVYLFCFSRSMGNLNNTRAQASHYLGWGHGNAAARIADHKAGKGSALTRAAVAVGISLKLVRTWIGDRNLERELKNKKNAKGICPECKKAYNEAAKIRMRNKRSK